MIYLFYNWSLYLLTPLLILPILWQPSVYSLYLWTWDFWGAKEWYFSFLISEIIEYLSFSVLPISFSTMPSGFVFHVVADDRISFFLCLNGILVCVWGVLYPVTLPWTLRLFPCLGHCKYAAVNMVWRSIHLFWVSLSTLKFLRNESTFSNHLYFHSYVTAFEYKIK